MGFVRLLRCCCPGTCDDGIVGNFFCESLHWDGGDCLVEDACGDTGECSMCGGHWDAVSRKNSECPSWHWAHCQMRRTEACAHAGAQVMGACPKGSGSQVIPSTCPEACAEMFSAWWTTCQVEPNVR